MRGKLARVRAGELRHRVTVRLPVEVKNELTGGFTVTYATVASRLPARVVPTGGKRTVSGEQVDARTQYDVRLRYRDDITARQQLLYHAPEGDRVLDITSVVDVDELHSALDLMCTEGQ